MSYSWLFSCCFVYWFIIGDCISTCVYVYVRVLFVWFPICTRVSYKSQPVIEQTSFYVFVTFQSVLHTLCGCGGARAAWSIHIQNFLALFIKLSHFHTLNQTFQCCQVQWMDSLHYNTAFGRHHGYWQSLRCLHFSWLIPPLITLTITMSTQEDATPSLCRLTSTILRLITVGSGVLFLNYRPLPILSLSIWALSHRPCKKRSMTWSN